MHARANGLGAVYWSIPRIARPYTAGPYSGILLEGRRCSFKLFYIEPYKGIVGTNVKIGQAIGTAQDISAKYKDLGVTPHVHLEIVACDPEILMNTDCEIKS